MLVPVPATHWSPPRALHADCRCRRTYWFLFTSIRNGAAKKNGTRDPSYVPAAPHTHAATSLMLGTRLSRVPRGSHVAPVLGRFSSSMHPSSCAAFTSAARVGVCHSQMGASQHTKSPCTSFPFSCRTIPIKTLRPSLLSRHARALGCERSGCRQRCNRSETLCSSAVARALIFLRVPNSTRSADPSRYSAASQCQLSHVHAARRCTLSDLRISRGSRMPGSRR
jgi:hypothetical protein